MHEPGQVLGEEISHAALMAAHDGSRRCGARAKRPSGCRAGCGISHACRRVSRDLAAPSSRPIGPCVIVQRRRTGGREKSPRPASAEPRKGDQVHEEASMSIIPSGRMEVAQTASTRS